MEQDNDKIRKLRNVFSYDRGRELKSISKSIVYENEVPALKKAKRFVKNTTSEPSIEARAKYIYKLHNIGRERDFSSQITSCMKPYATPAGFTKRELVETNVFSNQGRKYGQNFFSVIEENTKDHYKREFQKVMRQGNVNKAKSVLKQSFNSIYR